ncbi:TROVE domain-containing protein [Spiractinospora alimapuensis]|uniref:TROVE domain-containing protein n=1 Tax=Spiractinospora alimapuensis TaxID=2820884 RepID=UPI001F46D805|nr:TROVE domain-containing protein [Spiractinospora alimapuensis]QVQ53996.1 TROVE domain-containing protein [Spiractinospora alimapuensis]
MAKFNNRAATARGTSPVSGETRPTARTHEGAPGYLRDTRSELFVLAVSSMVGEDTFYEGAGERDERFRALVAELAVSDVEWLGALLAWLRQKANLRSAALVGALEATKARLDAGAAGHSRQLVASVLRRADEPGEALAYWMGRHGRSIPKPVKRGVADAVVRLYDERSLLKYDTQSHAYRFGDVLDLTHPTTRDERQGVLFQHALDRRHGRDQAIPTELATLRAREALQSLPVEERRAFLEKEDAPRRLQDAGMTWESLAGWIQGPLDATAWERIIPSMGYMARLRNLRNFDEAGVSDTVAAEVAAGLADPEAVARSRQMPMRFLAAYRAAPSLRWAESLERALQASLANVPSLPGRTLILVDRSGSMFGRLSQRSTLTSADAAAIFGAGLALRAKKADLVQFGTNNEPVPVHRGDALLRILERFKSMGGTNTAEAVRRNYRRHDRVVIVTDEQTFPRSRGARPTAEVPTEVPVYTWNLVGYRAGHGPSGVDNRHTFAGLNDAAFSLIPLIERGVRASWPWEDEER